MFAVILGLEFLEHSDDHRTTRASIDLDAMVLGLEITDTVFNIINMIAFLNKLPSLVF